MLMPLSVRQSLIYCFLLFAAAAWWPLCEALEVNLTEMRPYVEVNAGGETVLVQRVQDTTHTVTGFFAKTSRPCPPFCIRPMSAAPGVTTVGEYELFDFMAHQLRNGRGLIVDARTADWYQRGTIPGAINLPWDRIVAFGENPDAMVNLFKELGAMEQAEDAGWHARVSQLLSASAGEGQRWNFGGSKELILFCNGPWCDQSPRAIRALIDLGYPEEKLFYYRGGMQAWVSLGLSTMIPEEN